MAGKAKPKSATPINETPTLCVLELKDGNGDWYVKNEGWNLIDPQRYVNNVYTNVQSTGGPLARVTDKATGIVYEANNTEAIVTEEEVHVITDLPTIATYESEAKRGVAHMEKSLGDETLAKELEVVANLPKFIKQDKPKKKGKKKKKKKKKKSELDTNIEDILDQVTDPYVPSIEEAGHSLFIGMPTTRDYIFDGHAGAGPSGAERWMTCTASLSASRAFLETLTPAQQEEFAKGSTAARQGTTAHAAAESGARLILGEITEEQHEQTILALSVIAEQDEAYDEEMGEWIQEYGDLIQQYHQAGHEVMIEARVEAAIPLLTVDADGERDIHVISGSADAVMLPIKSDPVLTVADLKYGNGKDVDADENPQAKIYALAVLAMLIEMGYDIFDPKVIERIDIIIAQPRLGGIKTWSTTVNDLLDWQDDVLSPALTQALAGPKGGAAFNPSEVACQWCPARGSCVALIESRNDAAMDLFQEVQEVEYVNGVGTLLDSGALTNDRLAVLLDQSKSIVKIHEDLKKEAQRRLHRGDQVPGFHLVNYQPPRRWKEDAEEKLKDAPVWTEPELLSPTKAIDKVAGGMEGKTLKARKEAATASLADLIEVPEKQPVVAPEGDPRKPWTGRPPEQLFEDETATEIEA